VNPQWHDEFVSLCALFSSGELTEEEWALLQVHLAYCESCRVTFEEYQQLAGSVIPILAASSYSESQTTPEALHFSLDAAEQRLMRQLDAPPSKRESPRTRRTLSWASIGALAACVACMAAVIGLHSIRSKNAIKTPVVATGSAQQVIAPPAPAKSADDVRPELDRAEREIVQLKQQLSAPDDRPRQLNAIPASSEQQSSGNQAELDSLRQQKATLGEQLALVQAEAQVLREKSAEGNSATEQQRTRTAALEAKVQDLNAALDDKDRLLALDKGFLDHDREIRDLIGARDLYIADIYDVAQNGKTAKPFGRIFYTKDRSLVFYGYDLDKQSGLKQSVTFQAWGSGDDKQNVSLGLFYQDDTHKRWVLRFNDTKTLARLNKVFVTAEPQGGSNKPTGKPLLMAYLQVQPNHP
jgi:hypothetical protein